MTSLPQKIAALHAALDHANIPHAFGGALALAYCTAEARGTRDIDINIFVSPDRAEEVLRALPPDVTWTEDDVRETLDRGQVRIWWGDNAVDLFFGFHDFHTHVAGRIHHVPFDGGEIPVIDCTDLAVFKSVFARTKDWADIEAMYDAGSLDVDEAMEWIVSLLGEDSDAARRFEDATTPSLSDGAGIMRKAFGRPTPSEES